MDANTDVTLLTSLLGVGPLPHRTKRLSRFAPRPLSLALVEKVIGYPAVSLGRAEYGRVLNYPSGEQASPSWHVPLVSPRK